MDTLTLTTVLTSAYSSNTSSFEFLLNSIDFCSRKRKTPQTISLFKLSTRNPILLRHHQPNYCYFQHDCHCLGLVWSPIFWTQFVIDTLNQQTSLLIYPKTTLLSVQNISLSTWMSSSFFSIFEILIDSLDVVNSSLGIETDLKVRL